MSNIIKNEIKKVRDVSEMERRPKDMSSQHELTGD